MCKRRTSHSVRKETPREKALRIIDLISEGQSVRRAREVVGMTNTAFFGLLRAEPELMEQYTRARESKGEACLDRIEEVEDMVEQGIMKPDAARVIIDAEKWKAGKFYPKMYGDKAVVDMNVRSFSLFEKDVEEKAKAYADTERDA